MNLIEIFKNNINKDKNDENMPYLEINEVILVHYCKQWLALRFISLV